MMRLTLIGMLVLLAGCVQFKPYSSKNYVIGEPMYANVGQAMISVIDGKIHAYVTDYVYGYHSELIFTGISGKVVHLLHREYNITTDGVLIRPAFSLPVVYDISSDSLLTFRQYLIEVMAVTPSHIAFKVINDGSKVRDIPASAARQELVSKPFPKLDYTKQPKAKIITFSGVTLEAIMLEETEKEFVYRLTDDPPSTKRIMSKRNVQEIIEVK